MHLVSHGWGMLSRSRFRRIGGVVDLRHAMRTAVLQQAPLRCARLAVSRSCCGFCRLYHELPITMYVWTGSECRVGKHHRPVGERHIHIGQGAWLFVWFAVALCCEQQMDVQR